MYESIYILYVYDIYHDSTWKRLRQPCANLAPSLCFAGFPCVTPHNENVKSYKSVGCVPPRLKVLFRTFDRLPYILYLFSIFNQQICFKIEISIIIPFYFSSDLSPWDSGQTWTNDEFVQVETWIGFEILKPSTFNALGLSASHIDKPFSSRPWSRCILPISTGLMPPTSVGSLSVDRKGTLPACNP